MVPPLMLCFCCLLKVQSNALWLLTGLTRLETLKIEANQGRALVDDALAALNCMSRLRSLTLHKAANITDAGICVRVCYLTRCLLFSK